MWEHLPTPASRSADLTSSTYLYQTSLVRFYIVCNLFGSIVFERNLGVDSSSFFNDLWKFVVCGFENESLAKFLYCYYFVVLYYFFKKSRNFPTVSYSYSQFCNKNLIYIRFQQTISQTHHIASPATDA